jgi:hypothetical protein
MISTPTPDSIVVPLQLAGLEQQLSQVIGQILAFLPVVLSAIVILAVGFIVGRLLEAIVVRTLDSIGLSDYTGGTALESSGEGSGLERALGKIAAFYVYFVAILAAADVLQIPILSELLQQIGAFIPVVISAIVVLVIGFIVGRVIRGVLADLISGFNLGRFLRDTPWDASPGGVAQDGVRHLFILLRPAQSMQTDSFRKH